MFSNLFKRGVYGDKYKEGKGRSLGLSKRQD
jgi:hypothetical protein